MIEACPDHVKHPPVQDMMLAEALARTILKDAPSVVPEFMWETSYPPAIACCTRSALAYSLMHAAMRRLLG